MIVCCPVCGTAVPLAAQPEISFFAATGEIRYMDRKCVVPAAQLDVFELLFDAYPKRIHFDQLYRAIYKQDPQDTQARTRLRVHLFSLRRALRVGGLSLDIAAYNERGHNEGRSYALQVLTYAREPIVSEQQPS